MKNEYIDLSKEDNTFEPEKTDMLAIEDFLKYFENYDFNPYYQRNFIWPPFKQRKLIESIIFGRKISTVSVARKDNRENFNKFDVIDGKQRGISIYRFYTDEFAFPLKVGGETKLLKYSKIKKLAEKEKVVECIKFIEKFNRYHLSVDVYRPMSKEKQRELFEVINYSQPLHKNELLFCAEYSFCRSFYTNLWEKLFLSSGLNNNFQKSLKENIKEYSTRFASEVCYIGFDRDLRGTYSPRGVSEKDIRKSLEKMDSDLDEMDWPLEVSQIRDTHFEDLHDEVKENLEILDDAIGYLYQSISYSRICNSREALTKNTIKDGIIFFIRKIQEEKVTQYFVTNNVKYFHHIFKAYVYFCIDEKNKGFNNQSIHKKNVEKRQNKLDEIWIDVKAFYNKYLKDSEDLLKNKNVTLIDEDWDFSPIDDGRKNKAISKRDKRSAIWSSDGKDCLTHGDIDPSNAHFDHVESKTLSSDEKVKIMSSDGNELKSHLNKDVAKKISDS